MFAAILFCSAVLSADGPPVTVQVRLVYTTTDGEPSKEIEAWIKAKSRREKQVFVSMSKWITLSNDSQRLYSGNGIFIDGKVVVRDGKSVVQLEGCAGFEISGRAALPPGERGLYRVRGLEHTFFAVRHVTRESAGAN